MMRPLKNEKGVAMMMALVTFMILSVLLGEVVYESSVYNGIAWQQVDQYRAHLLAKSGLRLSLLQLKAAEKAKAKAGSLGLGNSTSLTDQIWKTPLVLPPPAPPGLAETDKQALDAFGKNLSLDGNIAVTIMGENQRLNINQLVWAKDKTSTSTGTSTSTATGTSTATASPEEQKQELQGTLQGYVDFVDQLLEQKRQADDAFRDKYGYVKGETLIKNLLAWMDPKTEVNADGRGKLDYYATLEPYPYALKNAPIASESEFYMVEGFDDTLANLLANQFTTQVTGGIDVNTVSASVLRALIPEIGEVEMERIMKRRTDDSLGGPFKDETDFWNFLATLGNFEDAKKRLGEQGIAILGPQTSYQVTITARSGLATKTWLAKIGPLPPRVDPVPATPGQPVPYPQTTNPNGASAAANNGGDSLNIIYLKAD
jgi:type II secretory pathway component PulK